MTSRVMKIDNADISIILKKVKSEEYFNIIDQVKITNPTISSTYVQRNAMYKMVNFQLFKI